MIEESRRNWLVSLAIDSMKSGKPPDVELDDEEKEAVERNIRFFKEVRDRVGEKAFSEMTIDTGYDI